MAINIHVDPCSEYIRDGHKRLKNAYARTNNCDVPVAGRSVEGSACSYKERLDDMDKMVEHAVIMLKNLNQLQSDWLPYVDTYCTVSMVAEAFGCKIEFEANGMPRALPFMESLSQVDSLRPCKIGESPLIHRSLEWIEYAQSKIGSEFPQWTVDIQSPFTVATEILGTSELLMACITDAEKVHSLLRIITEYSIEFMQAHLDRMDNPNFPGRNFPSIPERIGICISDDTPAVMLGPDMYAEFAIPYNERIAEVFGGLHLHSCGNYRHNLQAILNTKYLSSIQLHAGPGEFPLPECCDDDAVLNKARKQIACFVDSNVVSMGGKFRNDSPRFYEEYMIPRLFCRDTTGLILESCRTSEQDTKRMVEWTRKKVNDRISGKYDEK